MSNYSVEEIKAVILGHAVGDALGVPVEFQTRKALDADPVTDMRGYGTYPVPVGSWSDDTSMTLCALDALAQESFLWDAAMVNFGRWYYKDEFTPTGKMFDVGTTCRLAIDDFFLNQIDIDHCGRRDECSNGNGSLMRIAPFALFAPDDLSFIERASCLTHAHRRSQMACGIYSLILTELLSARCVEAYKAGLHKAADRYGHEPEWIHFMSLTKIEQRSRDSIRSSGYVVDTLEAALWCLATTDSYRECVLKAINLGDDTDTVAAIAGGLAGGVYGLKAIPREWLKSLQRKDYIEDLCEKAALRWSVK
ncbi:ADP-ribosylglycohydrolase family protein [Eubacteriales bacterium SGI.150]